MLNVQQVEKEFRDKVCAGIRLDQEGLGRYHVSTPFAFDDGDHLVIVLKQDQDTWLYSDEAHTYMHLSYDVEERHFTRGRRNQIIQRALSAFDVEDRNGELVVRIEEGKFGDALYSFIQALLKISDVAYLSRERVRSTFIEDLQTFFHEIVQPRGRVSFNWHDPKNDPDGKYLVDFRINGMPRPLFVHALTNDDRTRDATITLHQFEKWGLAFRSLAIFEDQESINRKVLARFSDVAYKQFSNFRSNKERIAEYVKKATTVSPNE